MLFFCILYCLDIRLCLGCQILPWMSDSALDIRFCLGYQILPWKSDSTSNIRFSLGYQILPWISGSALDIRLCLVYQTLPWKSDSKLDIRLSLIWVSVMNIWSYLEHYSGSGIRLLLGYKTWLENFFLVWVGDSALGNQPRTECFWHCHQKTIGVSPTIA